MSSDSARAVQTRTARNNVIKAGDVSRARRLIKGWDQMPRDREFCVEIDVLPTDSDYWCKRGRQYLQDRERGVKLTRQQTLYADWAEIVDSAAPPVGNGSPENDRVRLPLVPRAGGDRDSAPLRLTDEVIQTLCEDFRNGVPYTISLEAQGLSKGVLSLWLANADRADARVEVGLPPEANDEIFLRLRQELARARRDVAASRMQSLKEIGDGERKGDAGAHTWTLERLLPKEYRAMAPIEDEQSAGKRKGGGLTLILNQAAPQAGKPPIMIEGEVSDGQRRTLLLPDSDFTDEGA